MCKKNLVSIIMPNYNCGYYISQSIESVLAQTYFDWELLIVDDCSTDNSVQIAQSYAQKDSRIKIILNERNQGAAFSRNRAIEQAEGEFIAFLDSDDLWAPQKIEKQVFFMKDNDFLFTYTYFSEIDSKNQDLHVLVSGPSVVTKKMLFRSNYLGCLTVMYNQEILGKQSIRADIKKRNDHALWLKIIKKTNCYLLPETLSIYRKNNGLSNSSIIKMLKYHYFLYRNSENLNIFISIFYVFENLFWGYLRKKKYTKSTMK